MVEEIKKEIYRCEDCGLRYRDKRLAEKCEKGCKETKTCDPNIIKHSVENES